MSYSQLEHDTGLEERTVKRIVKELHTGRTEKKEPRPKWLEVELGNGFVTAKGRQNLYHGELPADLIDQLRAELLRWSRATPQANKGWQDTTPSEGRGGTGCSSGWPETTLTGDDQEEELGRADESLYENPRRQATETSTFNIGVDQFDRYYAMATSWGTKPGAQSARILLERSACDKNLIAILECHRRRCDPETLSLAIDMALTEMEARNADGNGARKAGLAACSRYFTRTLKGRIDDVVLDHASSVAKARSEQMVQEAILAKRLRAVEAGGGGTKRPRRRSSIDDLFNETFVMADEHGARK